MSSIDRMCDRLEASGLYVPRTVYMIRAQTRTVLRTLERGGRHTLPWEIDESDVQWFLQDMIDRNLTVSTRRNFYSDLRRWTEHYGNPVVAKCKVRWPTDTRPNADWLTPEQASALISHPKSPLQEIIIHCELCLGMRRVEVIRLTTASFDGISVLITGKGPKGGKPRRMPYHRNTQAILDRWLAERQSMVAEARLIDPTAPVPDSLLIWRRGAVLSGFSEGGWSIDKTIRPLHDQLGFSWGNHTLRRTFGRAMYRAGVPVATIAKMLGHESMEMTLRYIGVDLDDMTAAMNAFRLRDGMQHDNTYRIKRRDRDAGCPGPFNTHI
jgi:integrase/recombinase XerD